MECCVIICFHLLEIGAGSEMASNAISQWLALAVNFSYKDLSYRKTDGCYWIKNDWAWLSMLFWGKTSCVIYRIAIFRRLGLSARSAILWQKTWLLRSETFFTMSERSGAVVIGCIRKRNDLARSTNKVWRDQSIFTWARRERNFDFRA